MHGGNAVDLPGNFAGSNGGGYVGDNGDVVVVIGCGAIGGAYIDGIGAVEHARQGVGEAIQRSVDLGCGTGNSDGVRA